MPAPPPFHAPAEGPPSATAPVSLACTRAWGRPTAIEFGAVFLLVAIGVLRITASYPVFNQTYDEPFHIVRGYQWWKGHSYRHTLHPPLAPIVVGLGPVLSGIEVRLTGDKLDDGNAILYSGDYWRVLARARVGNLLFFTLAVCGTWAVGRSACGPVCGWASAAILAAMPPVLSHSGLATTDMAITATMIWTIWGLRRWLCRGTWLSCGLLGLTMGLALLSKHSAALFLLVYGLTEFCDMRLLAAGTSTSGRSRQFIAAIVVAAYVVWSGYGYSVGPVPPPEGSPVDARTALRGWRAMHVPAPEYFRGLLDLASKNRQGHAPFFWGSSSPSGHWAFFPVILAIKTPLPLMALCVFGFFTALLSPQGRGLRTPALAAILLLAAIALTTRINLGVRHVLPLYPLLSLCGGLGFVRLWGTGRSSAETSRNPGVPAVASRGRRGMSRVVAAGLLIAGWAVSRMSDPDLLAFFNCLAGPHPERIVVDSDLDWGQDLARLGYELTDRGIERSHLAYFGTADPARHGFSEEQMLAVTPSSTGWVAISVTLLMSDPKYEWLRGRPPAIRIGKSILLFHID